MVLYLIQLFEHSEEPESIIGIWGIFGQFISTHFSNNTLMRFVHVFLTQMLPWVPCPCFPLINHYFHKKLSPQPQILIWDLNLSHNYWWFGHRVSVVCELTQIRITNVNSCMHVNGKPPISIDLHKSTSWQNVKWKEKNLYVQGGIFLFNL